MNGNPRAKALPNADVILHKLTERAARPGRLTINLLEDENIMTKKILALALAGTTAFSVFASAMSVNAALNYVTYTPVTVTFSASGLEFGATADINVTYTKASDADTADHFNTFVGKYEDGLSAFLDAVAMNTARDGFVDTSATVENGKVYMYDFTLKTPASIDTQLTTLFNAISTYEAALAEAKALYQAGKDTWTDADTAIGGKVPDTVATALDTAENNVYAAFFAAYSTRQVGTASTDSTRDKAIKSFEAMLKTIGPAADYDFDTDTDADEYTELYDEVIGLKANNGYENIPTSRLVYLVQQQESLTDNVSESDPQSYSEWIEFYTEVLDARSAEDYKTASDFRTFQKDYEEIQEEYKDAKTTSKLGAYAAELKDLILDPVGQGTPAADTSKDELKAMVEDADAVYADSKRYDTKSDEWDTFKTMRTQATAVKDLAKKASYQSTIDAYVNALADAINALDPNSSVSDWVWVRLQGLISDASEMVESDYTSASWKKVKTALERAEKLLDSTTASKTVIENASDALEKAMKEVVILKPSATARRELKDKITEAKTALANAVGSGAQVVALSNAINDADNLWSTKYTSLKTTTTVSSIEKAIAALDAAMTSVNQPQGWYTTEAGAWMYGEGDGYYVDGWKKIGNFWFHFDANGIAKQNEWMSEGGKWYYFGNSCVAYAGWGKVDGSWYYFDKGNAMCTGWIKLGNTYYYLDPTSGKMVTGWATIGGTSYYFSTEASTLGAMLANTTTPDGYTVDANGAWVK